MIEQPTLVTERLVLRPFTLADADDVQRLAGAEEIADTTLNIPHPYADGLAEAWIESHAHAFRGRERVALAITESGVLVGAISLRLDLGHARAELGYWIGLPFWGKGYATEAAVAMVGYGFEELGLNRIFAHHVARNPASGRVLEKAGFTHEGFHRAHVLKNGRYEDLHSFAVLRTDQS